MSTVLRRVVDGFTYSGETDLKIMTCPDCGVTYAIPQTLQSNAYKRGHRAIVWFCPNGHELGYNGQSEAERERERAEGLERQLTRARQQKEAEADLRRHTERQLAAQKGATTKAKKRHAAGLCPCCNRSFAQLRRHMETQHPDYKPGGSL